MNDSYIMPIIKWTARCTNPSCGIFYEKQTFDPDVICPRCSGFLQVTNKIVFKEDTE